MAEIKKINTEFQLLDKFLDTSGDAGTSGQVLSSTASGVNWVSGGSLPGGPYLPLAGGTLTGDITLDDGSGASPSIYLKNGDDNFWRIFNGSNLDLTFRVGTVTKFSIDNSGNGTFAGNISFGDSHFIGDDADDNLLIQGSASENVIIRSEDGLYFRTGGNNTRLTINSSGNVGIGTTSPSEKLEVDGIIKVVHTDNSYANYRGHGVFFNRTENYIAPLADNTSTLNIGYNGAKWGNIEINGAFIKFENGPNEFMRVDSSGRLLINATSTAFNDKLYVNSDAYATGGWRVGTSTTYVGKLINDGGKLTLMSDGSRDVQVGNNNNPSILYVDTSEEKVGIGTPSPGAKLDVTGNYGDVIKAVSGSQNITTNFVAPSTGSGRNNITSTAGEFNIGTTDAQPFSLVTSSISRVSILSGGNVGIGTTSPGTILHVKGSTDSTEVKIDTNDNALGDDALIKFNGERAQVGWIDAAVTLTDGGGNKDIKLKVNTGSIFLQTNNTNRLSVLDGGNVGIGTISPSEKLHVAGYAKADTGFKAGNYTILNESGNETSLSNTAYYPMFFKTNNSTRMTISNAGNVGIGTTSPDSLLHVAADVSGANVGTITIEGRPHGFLGDDIATIDFHNNGTKLADIRMERGNASNDSQIVISTSDAGTLNDALIINEVGNVGIGTTSPGQKLDVNGSINVSSNVFAEGFYGDRLWNSNNAALRFGTNNTERARIDGNGNLGIGTTAPTNKLHIQGSQATVYSSTDSGGQASAGTTINNTNTAGNTNNFSQILFTVGTNNNSLSRIVAIRSGSDASDLAFVGKSAAGAAEYMRIKSGGNVGIGTTSPSSSLEVLKSASSTTISEARISSLVTSGYGGQANLWLRTSNYGNAMLAFGNQVGSSTVASSASGKISYNTFNRMFTVTADSNALLTLGGSNDRVGINQTSPQYTLDVTGNGRFTSTVTATNFINSSDERLKENIEEVCNNNVEVNWKTFNFKAEKEQKRYGVIAQELEKTNPEFVRQDSKGFKSVAYIDLLIAKIAELEARIQKLEK